MANANVTVNRKKYVGGSDLPNILGQNEIKYGKSVFDFAKEKMGLIPNTFKGNAYTKYGNLMEPIIRDYLNAKNGVNYIEDTQIDEDRLLRGNTDGIDRNTDFIPMLEVKTFGAELDVEYYTPQCRYYLETFDQPAIVLAGYPRPDDFYTGVDYDLENDDHYFDTSFDPEKLELHIIERDSDEWNRIYARVVAFQKACAVLVENPDMTLDEWNEVFYGKELVAKQKALIKLENELIAVKKINEAYDKAKKDMLEQFEKYGVKTLDTGTIRITHVKSEDSSKLVLDETKLKKAEPKIYEKYFTKKKVTKGRSYLRISVKEIGGDTV